MKTAFFTLMLSIASLSALADNGTNSVLKSTKEFIETCPQEYLTSNPEGTGPFCNCPDENIAYIDKAEGGPGFYCEINPAQ